MSDLLIWMVGTSLSLLVSMSFKEKSPGVTDMGLQET